MKVWCFTLALLSLPGAARAATPRQCQAAHGEWILAGDLAISNPVFASLDPQLALGPAPMAGARRDYRGAELSALARRYGLRDVSVREACFEWPAEVLSPGVIREAMARVLGCDAGAIEVVEFSRFPAPRGELTFVRQDLAPVRSSGERLQLWRGSVIYGAGRTFPVWARVRIALPAARVVALTALAPGEAIREEQVERRIVTDSPIDGTFALSVDEVAGRVPTSRIESGTAIRLASLRTKPEINAGDQVQVEVRNGAMRIYAVARAEQSGRVGDTIPLTNLQSSARFRARVDGRNKVSVSVAGKEQR